MRQRDTKKKPACPACPMKAGGTQTGHMGQNGKKGRVPKCVPINANGVIELDTRGHVGHVGHVKKDVNEFALESIDEDCAEFYEERAAIMQFDGGQSRDAAEAAARDATEKHRRECFERLQNALTPS